jgi:hypothetical protein
MPSQPDPHLMKALAFDADDLAANQAGELSPRQRHRLTTLRRLQSWLLTFGLALTGMAVAMVLRVRLSGPLVIWVGAAVGIWALGFGPAQTLFRWLGYDRDLKQGRVRAAQGTITVGSRRGRLPYVLKIAGQVWELGPRQRPIALAFQDGETYTLYYAPGSRTILSGEQPVD